MQLDDFFEDFEARFESELEASQQPSAIESANLIRVVKMHEGFVDLVACLLGRDFVAGMALGRNNWQLIRFASVAELRLSVLREVPIPALRFVDLDVAGFLNRLPMPLSISLTETDSTLTKQCLLLEVRGDCLITQSTGADDLVGIPLSAVANLCIDSVENFSEG
ncbi:MAG: hypothetical protein ACKOWI_00690 [Rhodoluna sp.]